MYIVKIENNNPILVKVDILCIMHTGSYILRDYEGNIFMYEDKVYNDFNEANTVLSNLSKKYQNKPHIGDVVYAYVDLDTLKGLANCTIIDICSDGTYLVSENVKKRVFNKFYTKNIFKDKEAAIKYLIEQLNKDF